MNAQHWTTHEAVITVPSRRKDIILDELGAEATLTDPDNGSTYYVNQTALTVWRLCEGERTTPQGKDVVRAVHIAD